MYILKIKCPTASDMYLAPRSRICPDYFAIITSTFLAEKKRVRGTSTLLRLVVSIAL